MIIESADVLGAFNYACSSGRSSIRSLTASIISISSLGAGTVMPILKGLHGNPWALRLPAATSIVHSLACPHPLSVQVGWPQRTLVDPPWASPLGIRPSFPHSRWPPFSPQSLILAVDHNQPSLHSILSLPNRTGFVKHSLRGVASYCLSYAAPPPTASIFDVQVLNLALVGLYLRLDLPHLIHISYHTVLHLSAKHIIYLGGPSYERYRKLQANRPRGSGHTENRVAFMRQR